MRNATEIIAGRMIRFFHISFVRKMKVSWKFERIMMDLKGEIRTKKSFTDGPKYISKKGKLHKN